MAYSYPVKFIHSGMRNAPALSGTTGTLVAVLDALLISGWGAATALSVTVTGGVGTATFNAGTTFDAHAVVAISGASEAILNGEARVLTSASSGITFETDAPDGAYSGVIAFRYAPVGQWEIAHTATGKRVYRSTDALGNRFFYRVDDSSTGAAARTARVRAYESMTDIDTGTNPAPNDSQMSGGGYWGKSSMANATASGYYIFADSRFILYCPQVGRSQSATFTGAFSWGMGDYTPLSNVDVFSSGVSVGNSGAYGDGVFANAGGVGVGPTSYDSGAGTYLMRAHSGLGGAVLVQSNRPEVGSAQGLTSEHVLSGADGVFGAAPSSVTGDVLVTRRILTAHDSLSPRCAVPGYLYIPQSNALSILPIGSTVPGTGPYAGRTLLSIPLASTHGAALADAVALVDITGPWR